MRYYFDVMGEGGKTTDEEGLECRDAADMRRKAMAILAEIATDLPQAEDRFTLSTEVRDAHGIAVYQATLMINGRELGPS